MHSLIKALKERRANAWEEAKAILDKAAAEGRDLTGEEESAYQAINADLDSLDQRVKEYTDAEERSRAAAEAFDTLLAKKQTGPVQGADSQDELRSFLNGERGRTFDVTPRGKVNFRDLSKASAGAGAATVPTSFYDRLIAHMIEVSGVLNAGPTVLNTASGESLEVPTTTGHSTGALVAEAAAISESDPAFAKRTLGAYKYGVLIQVSRELLTDTGVDLEGYLAMQAGRAIGNAFGVHLVTGDGTAKPTGIVTTASSGVTGGTGVSGAFTGDDLIDLHYSVIAPYRNSRSCGWLMEDATLGAARKLKDSNGQYLWQPGLQVGAPDLLLGKPVHTDPNVAAVAIDAESVVFGDFSAYFVRLAGGVRFERSDEYAFNTDLVTFRAVMRGDGLTVDQTGALKTFVGGAS